MKSEIPTASYNWRSIVFGTKLLKKWLRWRLGQGDVIKFWQDRWVPGLKRLENYAKNAIPAEMQHISVDKFFNNGIWDYQSLISWLPMNTIQRICNIHGGRSTSGVDKAIWGLNHSREFNVKSAYQYLHLAHDVWKWQGVWNLKILPKTAFLLWFVCHGMVLTNQHRVDRGLALTVDCQVCNVGLEDLNHLFRCCNISVKIWQALSEGSYYYNAGIALQIWLKHYLLSKIMWQGKFPWNVVFLFTLWLIWKWRCVAIFEGAYPVSDNYDTIIDKVVHEWNDTSSANTNAIPHAVIHYTWKLLEIGIWKLNIDGGCNNLGIMVVGGVIRDWKGNWIADFTGQIRYGNALLAELWGLSFGLTLCLSHDCNKLEVEVDSKECVQLISSSARDYHPY